MAVWVFFVGGLGGGVKGRHSWPGASLIKVAAHIKTAETGMECAYASSTAMSGIIEIFYVEKGSHSYASLHPCLELTQSETLDGEIPE